MLYINHTTMINHDICRKDGPGANKQILWDQLFHSSGRLLTLRLIKTRCFSRAVLSMRSDNGGCTLYWLMYLILAKNTQMRIYFEFINRSCVLGDAWRDSPVLGWNSQKNRPLTPLVSYTPMVRHPSYPKISHSWLPSIMVTSHY